MKIACVQCNVAFGDPMTNLDFLRKKVAALRSESVDLIVFPECFLTGYCFGSYEEALSHSLEKDIDPILRKVQAISDESGAWILVGYAAREGEQLFNLATVFSPNQSPMTYAKAHLPELGFDRFVTVGEELPVFETPWGRIGIQICFDLRHPEPFRILALEGADLIILPTNWPIGAEFAADMIAPVRAVENKTFMATCNRVGEENSFRFIGKSKIISPLGQIIAAAINDEEVDLIADLNLIDARNKRNVVRPGEHETTIFESRRPELYERLTQG